MARATRAEWAERIRQWRASKLTAEQFAAREGLNAGSLRVWSSKLRRESKGPIGFVEVALPPVPAAGRIDIVLRAGLRIEVSGEVDLELLRRVVMALELP